MPVDEITLNFSPAGLAVLNVVLALVMFGVALEMRVADFRRVVTAGKPVLLGLTAQFLLLPALTFVLVLLLRPAPSMALGMMLVAACPGGNLSNFLTHLARGNTALSVTMSAVSTSAATVMTPLNIAFWGALHPGTRTILRQVDLDPLQMLLTVVTILAVPITLGMAIAARHPRFARRLEVPMKRFAILVFAAFVAIALAANWQHFVRFVGRVAGLVAVHNASALALGYAAARLAGLGERDRRAVSIEVGIQNSGLGLLIVFTFFGGLGGMAIVAAWWGVWHILSGLTLAFYWSRKPLDASAGIAAGAAS
jgi:bile acid:Na+ symporter, BASS family